MSATEIICTYPCNISCSTILEIIGDISSRSISKLLYILSFHSLKSLFRLLKITVNKSNILLNNVIFLLISRSVELQILLSIYFKMEEILVDIFWSDLRNTTIFSKLFSTFLSLNSCSLTNFLISHSSLPVYPYPTPDFQYLLVLSEFFVPVTENLVYSKFIFIS